MRATPKAIEFKFYFGRGNPMPRRRTCHLKERIRSMPFNFCCLICIELHVARSEMHAEFECKSYRESHLFCATTILEPFARPEEAKWKQRSLIIWLTFEYDTIRGRKRMLTGALISLNRTSLGITFKILQPGKIKLEEGRKSWWW